MGFPHHRWGKADASRLCYPESGVLMEVEVFVKERRGFNNDDVLRRYEGEEVVEDAGEKVGCCLDSPRAAVLRCSAVVGQNVDDDDVS